MQESIAVDCFANQRMPKIVQVETSNGDPQSNIGVAIASSETLDAIFTGGGLTQSAWLDGLDGWAHVGRIDLQKRTWTWHKQFAEKTEQKLKYVTALAVDPAGLKVACHGYSGAELNGSQIGYVFVLDAGTGTVVSSLMKMTHKKAFVANSAGFMLNNDGRVYLTQNVLTAGSDFDIPQLICFDSVSNTLAFNLQNTAHPGKVMSIARDESINEVYAGGSMLQLKNTNTILSINQIPADFGVGQTAKELKLAHDFSGTCITDNVKGHLGYDDGPYISHLAHMYSIETDSYQLFGLTQSHNAENLG